MSNSLPSLEKRALVQHLNDLSPSDFEELRYILGAPHGVIPGHMAPQKSRGVALLEWAESPGGCGIDEVYESIYGHPYYPVSPSYAYPSYGSSSIDAGGCGGIAGFIALIVIGIGFFSIMNNFRNPLSRYASSSYPSNNPKANLFHEVDKWDIPGATRSINTLMASPDQCDQAFGARFYNLLAARQWQPDTLNNFNSAIADTEKETGCQW